MTTALLLPAIATSGPPLTNVVHHADALALLTALPSGSVNLIATDPPYMGVKDEAWDNQWESDTEYLAWIGKLCEQFKRVLAFNGSLYIFASPQMAARVEVKVSEYFNVLNRITWRKDAGWQQRQEKEALRAYFPASEAIIFAEQYTADNRYASTEYELNGKVFLPLKTWFRGQAKAHHITLKTFNSALGAATNGGGLASGYFGDKVEFQLPTEQRYQQMQIAFPSAFDRHYDDLKREYEDLKREYEDLKREYEDLRRTFNITPFDPFTDVWTFNTVQWYEGKHPCEKPIDMMRHIIRASSRKGDIVLDPFVGSGVTAIAALDTERQFIVGDMDNHWAAYTRKRLAMPYMIPMFESLGA